MGDYNHHIKLNKVHTNPKKGYKRGTASAAWKKIRSATGASGPHDAPCAPSDHGSGDSLPGIEGNGDNSNCKSNAGIGEELPLVEFGTMGEIFLVYPTRRIMEIWTWESPDGSTEGDTLYLNYQVELNFPGIPSNYTVLDGAHKLRYLVVFLFPDGEDLNILTYQIAPQHKVARTFNRLNIHFPSKALYVKRSSSFFLVANDEGYIVVLKVHQGKLRHLNTDGASNAIRKFSSQPVIGEFNGSVDESVLILKTSCDDDGIPIFDIVDNWFVYSPVKTEYKFLKAINETKDKTKEESTPAIDPIITNFTTSSDEHRKRGTFFTPVKLPPPGPLLNKFISTFSNSALDGLYKLSEMSATKMKAYYSHEKTLKDNDFSDISLNSVGKAVGKLLYSTASTLQNSTKSLKPNSNQLIKVLDLSNDELLGIFKPPGGVSKVSLSPYDLQLVSANLRGDSFFLWDLYRLPEEISLLGKFTRGKTSAIVEDIFWLNNNNYSQRSTNSNTITSQGGKINEISNKFINRGFGCITKSTGSVHWFNTNYLYESLNHKKGGKGNNGVQIEDAWILPSFGAKRFFAAPMIANVDLTSTKNEPLDSSQCKNTNKDQDINQLAIIDKNNNLKLISTLNGRHFYKYILPTQPTEEGIVPICSISDKAHEKTENAFNPLSQAEIETCSPFSNLINRSNIVFETYDFEEQGRDSHFFFEAFEVFGNTIPGKEIHVDNRKNSEQEGQHYDNSYSDVTNIYIDQEEDLETKPLINV